MTDTAEATHYQILRVPRGATRREIQAAFRRLAKVYHPDRNPMRVEWAEARMRELLRAYEVLSNESRRAAYDLRLEAERRSPSMVERLERKKDDPRAQSHLILHHLLQGDFDSAVDLHEELVRRQPMFTLASHLDERDYLDSLFLLGEAYESRGQWHTAVRFYSEAYERERVGPKKRYFFDEVKDRLRVLFSQRLIPGLSAEDALANYERALPLCLNNRDAALIHKKMAAILSRLGRRDDAVRSLTKAQELCPRMKTIDALKKKIAGT